MALTMAQNSLFAILLRSPWYYSMALGCLMIALGLMVASGKFLIVGITAALPFFGIAGYSAYKQLQRPSKKRILEVAHMARSMPPREVAARIGAAYQAERYTATPFKLNGADLELTRGGRTLLLSTKRFKAANTGIEPLKQLIAAGEKAEASGCLYVALGEISENARQYAKENYIDIIDTEQLAALFDQKAKID